MLVEYTKAYLHDYFQHKEGRFCMTIKRNGNKPMLFNGAMACANFLFKMVCRDHLSSPTISMWQR